MKHALSVLALSVLLFTIGCKPAPLPTGAINSVDAGINETLQSAHAALVKYTADVKAGVHVQTAAEKPLMNKVIRSLNTADKLYQDYHAALKANPAAGEPAELAAALTAVTNNLDALLALVKGK